MSVIPPILFSLAAIVAMSLALGSLKAALPGLRLMRRQLRDGSTDVVITSATLSPRLPVLAATMNSRLRRRGMHPKPVTHRLHHYPRPFSSAA